MRVGACGERGATMWRPLSACMPNVCVHRPRIHCAWQDRVKALATNRKPWDSTVWRYVPPSVKGLRCVTDEPWARDEELFDRELTPRGLRGEAFDDQHYNLLR